MGDNKRFGRYEVRGTIGRGAMGIVYLAEDPVIGRQVAIKVVVALEGLEEDEREQMQARFEREFQSAGRLSHPNIVGVHDVGQEDGNTFIAMEYVAGESLHAVLAGNRSFTFKEIADLTTQLCAALDYAHEFGVVHRDIKPANILITRDGRPKITDFGVARVATTTLTRTGTVIGTPAYMSPEQVTGHPVTGAADQFSLAVMVYEMITGERPFSGENPTTIMYKIVHEEVLPPSVLNALVPAPLDKVLIRALAKDPDDRYPTCAALADELRASLGAAPAEVTVVMGATAAATVVDPSLVQPKRPRSGRAKRRGPGVVGLAILGFVVISIAVGAWAYNRGMLSGSSGIGATDSGVATAPAASEPVRRTLTIEARDGWQIWVNDVDSGLLTPSPVELEGLPDDEVNVELRSGDLVLASATFSLGEEFPGTWVLDDVELRVAASRMGNAAAMAAGEEADETPVPSPVPFVIVSTPPGAAVTFDGEALDEVTPVEVTIDLSTDAAHSVVLELGGYDSEGFQFVAGDLTEGQLSSRRLDFFLTSSVPPGFMSISSPGYPVAVTITPLGGGSARTHAAANEHDISLSPGRYRVELSAPSVFWSSDTTIDVASEQIFPVSVPRAVTVQVGAFPGNCTVSIDGIEVGPQPFPQQITVGTHQFSFEWAAALGLESKTVTISINSDTQRVFETAGGNR